MDSYKKAIIARQNIIANNILATTEKTTKTPEDLIYDLAGQLNKKFSISKGAGVEETFEKAFESLDGIIESVTGFDKFERVGQLGSYQYNLIEKSRTPGIYSDTPENRKLNRVGQHYGKGKEEVPAYQHLLGKKLSSEEVKDVYKDNPELIKSPHKYFKEITDKSGKKDWILETKSKDKDYVIIKDSNGDEVWYERNPNHPPKPEPNLSREEVDSVVDVYIKDLKKGDKKVGEEAEKNIKKHKQKVFEEYKKWQKTSKEQLDESHIYELAIDFIK